MNNIITALIAALPPTLMAILAWRESRKNARAIQDVHISINSRMTELLKATQGESRAEGREIGRAETK